MTDTQNETTEQLPQPASVQGGRYALNDDGQIFFQPDASNPLPGEVVGKITKGDALLSPKTDHAPAQDWLDIHVRTVLEPLFALKAEAGEGVLTGAAREIGDQLYDHLGVVHRSDLEESIAKLDPDLRKLLRGKGIRLGPILAFLPALVKPAAIKMRALLWGLWNEKPLPVVRPVDGRVSEVVDPAVIDRAYYRMIGYPVFGPRAIRIDMLDRVVTDVYDAADKGVFEAKHKYAEWLGCNLDDLHVVLESMGHRRLKEAAAAETAADGAPDEVPAPTGPEEKPEPAPQPAHPEPGPAGTPPPMPSPARPDPGPAETPAPSGPTEIPLGEARALAAAVAKPAPVVVKFMLKRGKMSDRPAARKPRHDNRKPRNDKQSDKPKTAFDPNKPVLKKDGDRPRKPKFDRNKDKHQDRAARVYTFEGKKSGDDDDGNPFAVLKNLKQ